VYFTGEEKPFKTSTQGGKDDHKMVKPNATCESEKNPEGKEGVEKVSWQNRLLMISLFMLCTDYSVF